MTPTSTPAPYANSFTVLPLWASPCPSPSFLTRPLSKMSAGQGSCPLPWHRASFPADLFPQSQPHRAALEVRQKTVPLFDLLQRLRRLQTGHLRFPCSNQHRPQGHSRFPPHPPFPDILKITDRAEGKYIWIARNSRIAKILRILTLCD